MALKRGVPDAILAELRKIPNLCLLVHVDWPEAPVRAHSGLGAMQWNGHTWLGVGEYGGIELPEEAASDVPAEASLMLVGTLEKLFANLDDDVFERDVDLYVGVTRTPGGNDLIDAHPLMIGYVSAHDLEEQVGQPEGEVAARLTVGTGPSARAQADMRHSFEDQIARHPGDTLFRHTVYMAFNVSNPQQW